MIKFPTRGASACAARDKNTIRNVIKAYPCLNIERNALDLLFFRQDRQDLLDLIFLAAVLDEYQIIRGNESRRMESVASIGRLAI